jgi:hypothetical protein
MLMLASIVRPGRSSSSSGGATKVCCCTLVELVKLLLFVVEAVRVDEVGVEDTESVRRFFELVSREPAATSDDDGVFDNEGLAKVDDEVVAGDANALADGVVRRGVLNPPFRTVLPPPPLLPAGDIID